MHRLRAVAAGIALAAGVTPAAAGIVFTPHLSEYSRLAPGQFTEFTFIYSDIEHVYNREGKKVHAGAPFVAPGNSVEANLLVFKSLWIGNVFRDTGVWYLNDHPQFCRLIGVLGWQQASEAIVDRGRLFGLTSGGNGLGDLFGLCGVYTDEHRWGPVKANGLWGGTVKFPVGRYDTDALLNTGTHYWAYMPSFSWHAEIFGRIFMDGIFAYQINEDNDTPAFGGTTPTGIADWRNYEMNVAWKFSEHWYADVGYSYRESVGPNRYDKLTVNFKDPVPAQAACDNTNNGLGIEVIDPALCNSTNEFFLNPHPGPYYDRGIFGRAVTAGFYYIYRTSSVLNLRVFWPVGGRGSQFDAVFDVCTSRPCSASNRVATTGSILNGVQEAAAVSASPYFQLRFVYLYWAP